MRISTFSGSLFAVTMISLGLALLTVSPVGAVLSLEAEANPDPVEPGQMLDTQITVSTTSSTGALTLRVLWPEELNTSPVVTGGGTCPGGGCQPGEYLSWNLGVLGPGVNATVSFDETVFGTTVDGTLIPLEVELIEGGLPARNIGQTALVHPFDDFDGDGEADVFDEDDDNDGMPDWWENLHDLDPFDETDADDDPDHDGFTNLEEYLGGTDPNIPDPFFMDGFESGDTSAWTLSVP